MGKKLIISILGISIGAVVTSLQVIKQTRPTKAQTNSTVINFTESNEDFRNPERGFYNKANVYLDKPLNPGVIAADNKFAQESLVWVYFHLENYRDPRDGAGIILNNYQGRSLNYFGAGTGLDTVRDTFTTARNKGLKLVIRFLYIGYSGIGSTSNPNDAKPDAPISLVRQHINELAPVINENKDVIAAVQFGFVGYWGEWHSSKYLSAPETKKEVMDAVLAAVPPDRMVELRYPRYKQYYFGGPVNATQAYNQTDVARIGYHNDAFLRDANDGGTFKSKTPAIGFDNTYCDGTTAEEIACWRDYVNKDSKYLVVGGEAGTHASSPSEYAHCPGQGFETNVIQQMELMHFNSIHDDYAKVNINTWDAEGCLPEIVRRLGYRYALKDLIIANQVSPGGSLPINLTLVNRGFGALYNPRIVYIVLKNNVTGTKSEIALQGVDPRSWQPGQTWTISQSVKIPSNLSEGNYSVYLWLPDMANTIRTNPNYAIRFANSNTWNASTGYNLLFSNLQIAGTPLPTNTPTPTPKASNTPTPTKIPTPTPVLTGDINRDGVVNLSDYQALSNAYGTSLANNDPNYNPNADLNRDEVINIQDYQILSSHFGNHY